MTPTLYLTKGLPASGKSTWAKAKVKSSKNTYIVNRDSFRKMLTSDYSDFPFGHNILEKTITNAVILMVSKLLSKGYSVILDETNLNKSRTQNLIKRIKLSFENKNKEVEFNIETVDFTDVPLEECIQRDKDRSPSVGESVIRGMHKKYLYHGQSNI